MLMKLSRTAVQQYNSTCWSCNIKVTLTATLRSHITQLGSPRVQSITHHLQMACPPDQTH